MNSKIKLILLDLDGVIYDFVNHTLSLYYPTFKDSDIVKHNMPDVLGISTEEFWKKFDEAEGTFSKGNMYSHARELIDICKKYCNNIAFCSNGGRNPKHWSEKKDWYNKSGFREEGIGFILTQEKHFLSSEGVVLIDDFYKNINKFNENEGVGLTFPQYWNDLSDFRKENKQLEYIDCSLQDISLLGTKEFKKQQ